MFRIPTKFNVTASPLDVFRKVVAHPVFHSDTNQTIAQRFQDAGYSSLAVDRFVTTEKPAGIFGTERVARFMLPEIDSFGLLYSANNFVGLLKDAADFFKMHKFGLARGAEPNNLYLYSGGHYMGSEFAELLNAGVVNTVAFFGTNPSLKLPKLSIFAPDDLQADIIRRMLNGKQLSENTQVFTSQRTLQEIAQMFISPSSDQLPALAAAR
ncbi:MAG: hypothetical protein ABIE74_07730 [Pseudomonadota bacterium]